MSRVRFSPRTGQRYVWRLRPWVTFVLFVIMVGAVGACVITLANAIAQVTR